VDVPSVAAGDPIAYAAQREATEELYRAAVTAMRLLQDRQAHTPEEMLDPREIKAVVNEIGPPLRCLLLSIAP